MDTETMNFTVFVKESVRTGPFSPFFIAVHNEYAPDLFSLGMPPTDGLAEIAESGGTDLLQTMFESDSNVDTIMVKQGPEIPLLRAGEETVFDVTVSCDYPYVSMASMAVNTNDCFVGINHMMLMPDMVMTVPGYDAGSEVNNEDCDYIPGPACAGMEPSNLRTEGEGEGVVSVHRGVHGMWQGNMTHLDPSLYDWRNPMLQITVKEVW